MDHNNMNTTNAMAMGHKMTTHMTFFWGVNSEILFSHWPGDRVGMYVLALVLVFVLAVFIEWLNHASVLGSDRNHVFAVEHIRASMHAARVLLAYIVMLAVMSFNVGVLLVAVAGHGVGCFIFGRRIHGRFDDFCKPDLPPLSC